MPQRSLHRASHIIQHRPISLPQIFLNIRTRFNYPLLGRVAVFSTKVKNLLKFDAPDLDASDPFPFLFDGDDMDGGPDTELRVFPASDLIDGATMAVETNVSTYAIPARGTLTHLIARSSRPTFKTTGTLCYDSNAHTGTSSARGANITRNDYSRR